MKPGRMVMLVLGTLAALLGLGLLAGAAGVGWLNFQQRDEGYFTTQSHRFDAASSAITTAGLDVMVQGRLPDVIPSETAGSILLRGAAATPGKGIFVGIAPQQDAARYLEGVKRSEIRELNLRPFRVDYTEVPGRGPGPPGCPELLGRIRRRHRNAGTQMERPSRQLDRGGHERRCHRPGFGGSAGRRALRPALAAVPVAADCRNRAAGDRSAADRCRCNGARTARATAASSPGPLPTRPAPTRPLSRRPAARGSCPTTGNPDARTSRRGRCSRQRRHSRHAAGPVPRS